MHQEVALTCVSLKKEILPAKVPNESHWWLVFIAQSATSVIQGRSKNSKSRMKALIVRCVQKAVCQEIYIVVQGKASLFWPWRLVRGANTRIRCSLNRCGLPGLTFRSDLLVMALAGTEGSGWKPQNSDTRCGPGLRTHFHDSHDVGRQGVLFSSDFTLCELFWCGFTVGNGCIFTSSFFSTFFYKWFLYSIPIACTCIRHPLSAGQALILYWKSVTHFLVSFNQRL